MPTKEELEDRITELEDENQTLNDKLDSILDIAGAEDEDDSESDEMDHDEIDGEEGESVD